MKIYNYRPVTGEYLSESEAELSPLEENIYLIPANATETKPPNKNQNETVCFENGNWIIKPDFRGQTYYNKDTKQAVIIDFIGEIPANLVTEDNLYATEELAKIEQEKINAEERQFLLNTDWKVIRHRDQLDLGIETSLTDKEYKDLLKERQKRRKEVK